VIKVQNQPTYVARVAVPEQQARAIADLLSEALDPTSAVCSTSARADGRWQLDVHFGGPPDEASLRELIELAAGGNAAKALTVEKLAARDWIKESLEGLKPVAAGRFVVHGAHDRARVPQSAIGIEIEAAQAFGTGHHGTTRGCLIALDLFIRSHKPRHILDLGTGTGVLAIAAAKALHRPVLATDIDWRSALSARDNARMNGVGHLVEAAHAAGLSAPIVRARAPFDLVMANILLGPLQRLSAPIARQLMPNATVIISGLLAKQKNAAISAYRSQGLVLERSFVLDGWATLVMAARAL
jgi:ribosomal protein L11 methyltransferase